MQRPNCNKYQTVNKLNYNRSIIIDVWTKTSALPRVRARSRGSEEERSSTALDHRSKTIKALCQISS